MPNEEEEQQNGNTQKERRSARFNCQQEKPKQPQVHLLPKTKKIQGKLDPPGPLFWPRLAVHEGYQGSVSKMMEMKLHRRQFPNFKNRDDEYRKMKEEFTKLYPKESEAVIDTEIWLSMPSSVIGAGYTAETDEDPLSYTVLYWHDRVLQRTKVTAAYMNHLLTPHDYLIHYIKIKDPKSGVGQVAALSFLEQLHSYPGAVFLIPRFWKWEELLAANFTKIKKQQTVQTQGDGCQVISETYQLMNDEGGRITATRKFVEHLIGTLIYELPNPEHEDDYFTIPPGNMSRCSERCNSFVVPQHGAPRIRYRQRAKTFTCKVFSFCSALHYCGFEEEAKTIYSSDIVRTNKHHDLMKFNSLVNKLFSKKHRLQFVRQRKKGSRFDPLVDVPDKPVLVQLKGTYHCVTFFQDLIFEPSLPRAILCCKENLNLLCGKKGYQGLLWSMTFKEIELVPSRGML